MTRVRAALERGRRVGFRIGAAHPDGVAWVLVSKAAVSARLLELFSDDDEDVARGIVAKARENQRRPYIVQHYELRRAVHEAGDYEAPGDIFINDLRRFASLDEVAADLRERWGLELEDAQDPQAIDAP